ncbi:MAG: globin family protein, partial [Bdellovibrionota bacterium]
MTTSAAALNLSSGLSETQRLLITDSFERIAPLADTVSKIFYERLFELDPSTRPLFKEDLTDQRKKLIQMLAALVASLDDPGRLVPALEKLGLRHAVYSIRPEHFESVGQALLDSLKRALGSHCTPDVREAWYALYAYASGVMKRSLGKPNPAPVTAASHEGLLESGESLLQALERLGTNIFFADAAFNLIYINQRAHKTLGAMADTIRTAFGLEVNQLLGGSIDRFHKGELRDRVRAILSDKRNLPYRKTISVGSRRLDLNVNVLEKSERILGYV